MTIAAFDEVVMPSQNLHEIQELNLFLATQRKSVLVGSDNRRTELPEEVYKVLLEVVSAMSRNQAIVLTPHNLRLTTREAADFLGISRSTLIRLLDAGHLPYEQPSRHRLILLTDLVAYRKERHSRQRRKIEALTQEASEVGLMDDPFEADAVREAILEHRRASSLEK